MRQVVGIAHDVEGIKDGVRAYVTEHGKPPVDTSGDAEPYVGYAVSWAAINAWMRANPQEMEDFDVAGK